MISFEIPIRTVSNNREHYRVRAKRVKGERETTALAWRLLPKRATRAFVTGALANAGLVVQLTRIGPQDLDEHDNLPTSMKAIVDQVAAELGLPNDRDKRVTWTYGQERGKHGVRCSITPRVQTSAGAPLQIVGEGVPRGSQAGPINASNLTHETATIRPTSSAIGAEKKRNQVVRRAKSRRGAALAEGKPPARVRSDKQLLADARKFLADHLIKITPATIAIARMRLQMSDAVDAIYDTSVREGKEQRQISAMVSAGKLAVTALNMLGLPGDDLEDEEAERNAAKAQADEPASADVSTADAGAPDDLEAYE